MKRRFFTILSALSLLLFVAVCVLWVRSYHVTDVVKVGLGSVTSRNGVVVLLRAGTLRPRPVPMGSDEASETVYEPTPVPDVPEGTWDVLLGDLRDMGGSSFAGFRYCRFDAFWTSTQLYAMPYWAPLTVTAIASALSIARMRAASKPGQTGTCPSCGYDLRATPRRCPECGSASQAE